MICPICERRWAPFPEKDFTKKVVPQGDGGEVITIIPVSQAALDRRLSDLNSDDGRICDECVNEIRYARRAERKERSDEDH